MADERRAKIAQLNDQFRRAEDENVPGQMVMTSGLNAHVIEMGKSPLEVIELVSAHDDFSDDTDPYGERDFGAFVFEGEKCLWKIDYFADESMTFGSEAPEDPQQSYRVLTVMLAQEY